MRRGPPAAPRKPAASAAAIGESIRERGNCACSPAARRRSRAASPHVGGMATKARATASPIRVSASVFSRESKRAASAAASQVEPLIGTGSPAARRASTSVIPRSGCSAVQELALRPTRIWPSVWTASAVVVTRSLSLLGRIWGRPGSLSQAALKLVWPRSIPISRGTVPLLFLALVKVSGRRNRLPHTGPRR